MKRIATRLGTTTPGTGSRVATPVAGRSGGRRHSGRLAMAVAAATAAAAGSLVGLAAPAQATCVFPRILSMADAQVYEGTGPGTTTMVFKVTSSGCPRTSSVEYATNWKGLSPAVFPDDYTATIGTLSWAAGDTSARYVAVNVERDALDESNEHFWVFLHDPQGVTELADAWAAGNILDDDGPVKWNVDAVACTEGDPSRTAPSTHCQVTIHVSRPSPRDMTVALTTTDATAVAPDDYQEVAATEVTLPAGATTVTATVLLKPDWLCESDESLAVDLTVPSDGVVAGGGAFVTIVDDDPC